jgi:hypothetical protein
MINAALDSIEPRSQQAALAAPAGTETAAPDTASLADETPSKSEKRKVTFADTKRWWPLTACVAAILAPDPSEVIALSRPLPAIDKVAAHIRLSRLNKRTIKGARHELIKALEEGELTARSVQGVIPSGYWSRPREWLYENGTDQAGEYQDVVIDRTQMQKYLLKRGKELNVSAVKKWINKRLKDGKIAGQKAMWTACQLELGGRISRERFNELRGFEMGALQIDAPPPGRPPGR